MRCIICKQADTVEGNATVTLERDGLTFVVKRVPARVCPNCGEEYVEDKITSQLLEDAEEMVRAGAQVEVREFVPA